MLGRCWIAAPIDANNSGADVPMAIISMPVASLLKPSDFPTVTDNVVNFPAAR